VFPRLDLKGVRASGLTIVSRDPLTGCNVSLRAVGIQKFPRIKAVPLRPSVPFSFRIAIEIKIADLYDY